MKQDRETRKLQREAYKANKAYQEWQQEPTNNRELGFFAGQGASWDESSLRSRAATHEQFQDQIVRPQLAILRREMGGDDPLKPSALGTRQIISDQAAMSMRTGKMDLADDLVKRLNAAIQYRQKTPYKEDVPRSIFENTVVAAAPGNRRARIGGIPGSAFEGFSAKNAEGAEEYSGRGSLIKELTNETMFNLRKHRGYREPASQLNPNRYPNDRNRILSDVNRDLPGILGAGAGGNDNEEEF